MIPVVIAIAVGIIVFSASALVHILKRYKSTLIEEAKPYQEQERPYVDPAHFNEVMKHQQKQLRKMYKGKAL